MSDSQNQAVPEGWMVVALGDGLVADVQPGFACGVNTRDEVGIPHLRPMNVSTDGLIAYDDVKHVSPDMVDSDRKRLRQGDVLFNNTNSAELVGKTALYNDEAEVAFSNHMTRVRCSGAVLPKYCALALHQKWREGYFLQRCNRHVSQASISQTVLKETVLPLPPMAEQKRIVSKVEALLARVRSVRQRLAAVPGILKHFRQAVLAHACSGKLTEDCRMDRDLEPAEALLKRAAEEKRSRYEQACRSAKSEGRRKPPKPKGLEPAALRDNALPRVPDEWAWTTFDHMAHDITVGFVGPMQSEYRPSGVPFLRSLNVREFRFEPKDLKYVSSEFHEALAKSALHPGDVVTVRSGNPGTTCVIPPELTEANCSDLVISRLTSYLLPQYAAIFINSEATLRHIESVKVGIAQGHFNIGSMRETPVAVPPFAEQQEIVRRVEALLEMADSIAQRVQGATKRAEVLTQSILARAFRGELVPTEAELARAEGRDYETAEQLLAGIREELAQRKPEKKTRRKTLKRKKVVMKKLDSAGVQKVIQGMPADRFSFADLRKKLPGDYDALKDILFTLLDDSESGLEQVFDAHAKAMRFHRRTKA